MKKILHDFEEAWILLLRGIGFLLGLAVLIAMLFFLDELIGIVIVVVPKQ